MKIQGSHILKKLIEENPAIVAGDGRTLGTQALMQVSQYQLLSLTKEIYIKTDKKLRAILFQLVGLGMTLLASIILGAATGLFISMKKLFETIPDDQLFNDELFWVIADDDNAGFYQPEVKRNSSMNQSKSIICITTCYSLARRGVQSRDDDLEQGAPQKT